MATIKIKFKEASKPEKEGIVIFRIIHDRVVRQLTTDYKLFRNEWNASDSEVVIPPGCSQERSAYLKSVHNVVSSHATRLTLIIERLEKNGSPYTVDQIVALYNSIDSDGYFISFARKLIECLDQVGKELIAVKYSNAVRSFQNFYGEFDVPIESIDSEMISKYEQWMKGRGLCRNTTSFYMRNLRAIYNRAVEKGLTVQRFPFRPVYTGIDRTMKRALPVKTVRKIKNLDLTKCPRLEYVRDLFMFSFYTRGMSFIDMAFLKKKDLQNGIVSYRRMKTNQQLFIKWEKPMQDIVDKYDTGDSPFLLPIIKDNGKDIRKQYKYSVGRMNYTLKQLGKRIGLDIPLTSYVARHSWASIAKSKNIPISTISEAMGHDSESTTRIYLATLDTSLVDKANSIVINVI